MTMHPYLSFKGDCEAAFTVYAQCFGGEVAPLFRYAGSPMADQVPADWGGKVMHGSVTFGGHELMGGDVAPDRYEAPKGFALYLQPPSAAEAERVFAELATGGQVVVPLAHTFWSALFGQLVDRFGQPWIINCDATE